MSTRITENYAFPNFYQPIKEEKHRGRFVDVAYEPGFKQSSLIKIRFHLKTVGNHLVMAIDKMDERFRATKHSGSNRYEASNGIIFKSESEPRFEEIHIIHLQGLTEEYDRRPFISPDLRNHNGYGHALMIEEAMIEWSRNWGPYAGDKALTDLCFHCNGVYTIGGSIRMP